jgi:alanine racemase
MADVTELPEVEAGREALLLGDEPGAWELAELAGTNAWQVLAGIGSRLPRVYLEAGVAAASRD